MSDRQKGLIPAIEELFPHAEHRFCIRHIYTNFRRRFHNLELKKLVWGAAQSNYVHIFEKVMEAISKESKAAHDYLNNIPPHHWSRSHFRTTPKCDMLLNNLCECFNSFILDARSKGVITMNEIIRTKLMKRIHKKRDSMKRVATVYYPKIYKKLEKSKEFSWRYTTEWSGGDRFQVFGPGGQYVVETKERTCTCRRWDLIGIPCGHAINAIWYNNDNPENYLHDCYKVSTFLKCYSHLINPTTSNEFWPKATAPPVMPPLPVHPKTKKERIPTKRRLEEEEIEALLRKGKVSKKGVVMSCSLCGSKEHNRRYHKIGNNQPVQKRRKKLPVSNQS